MTALADLQCRASLQISKKFQYVSTDNRLSVDLEKDDIDASETEPFVEFFRARSATVFSETFVRVTRNQTHADFTLEDERILGESTPNGPCEAFDISHKNEMFEEEEPSDEEEEEDYMEEEESDDATENMLTDDEQQHPSESEDEN